MAVRARLDVFRHHGYAHLPSCNAPVFVGFSVAASLGFTAADFAVKPRRESIPQSQIMATSVINDGVAITCASEVFAEVSGGDKLEPKPWKLSLASRLRSQIMCQCVHLHSEQLLR